MIVEAVEVDAENVNDEFVDSSCELSGLRIVLVKRGRRYFL